MRAMNISTIPICKRHVLESADIILRAFLIQYLFMHCEGVG